MDKQETIFRQKSVDRVSSPEQLDNYLKVTSPSVWLVLVGIIIILLGTIIWSTFGKLKTYANVGCVVEEGNVYCYCKEDEKTKIKQGMTVEIPSENKSFVIEYFEKAGVKIPDSYSYLQHIVGATSDEYVFSMTSKTDMNDGYYTGRVETESVSPLKFIFN